MTEINRIDLLPESIRLRCQQGLRTGRYIGAIALALVMVVATATHSRFQLERAQERYTHARATADLLLQTEAKHRDISEKLRAFELKIERHEALALPVRVTSLLATLVNRLPASTSLDRLDLSVVPVGSAGMGSGRMTRQAGGAASSAGEYQPTRMIVGELAGFAATDHDISTLIHALENTPPLGEISLDFSRTRAVRGQPAREFRISFRFDPDRAVEVREGSGASGQASSNGVHGTGEVPGAATLPPALTGVTDAR